MAAKFAVSIDVGGTNLRVALLDLRYRVIDKRVLDTGAFSLKDTLIAAIISSVKKIIAGNRLRNKDILGVGLGLPGPTDERRGIVHFLPNIPGWRKVNLKRILEKALKLPVFLDNDAKLMALAESRIGATAGFKNALCLTLGTGVGAGIIIEGKLYRGDDNASAEIGHLPINEIGPGCNCGGRACLETYIGNKRILRQARFLFKRQISLEELSSLAKRGDKKATALWQEVGGHLGVALAGAINLLNPGCIVIGGGISGAGKILFDKVKQVIAARAMKVQSGRVRVFRARLGNDSGLIGAAIMVKEGKAL